MAHKCKLSYRDIQKIHKGKILLLFYSDGSKTLAFSPVDTVDSHMMCECGYAVWNATNFGNLVHFCPNREIEVLVTDYNAINPEVKQ